MQKRKRKQKQIFLLKRDIKYNFLSTFNIMCLTIIYVFSVRVQMDEIWKNFYYTPCSRLPFQLVRRGFIRYGKIYENKNFPPLIQSYTHTLHVINIINKNKYVIVLKRWQYNYCWWFNIAKTAIKYFIWISVQNYISFSNFR